MRTFTLIAAWNLALACAGASTVQPPGTVVPNSGFRPASLANPTCNTTTCDVIEGELLNLPFVAIAGDVILLDPDGSVSDVVRFFNDLVDTGGGTGLGDIVFIYSKMDSGPDNSLGPDLGLPPPSSYSANAVAIAEAPDGQPTLFNGNGTLYSFYSDAPEPSTLSFVGLAFFGLIAVRGHQLFVSRGRDTSTNPGR